MFFTAAQQPKATLRSSGQVLREASGDSVLGGGAGDATWAHLQLESYSILAKSPLCPWGKPLVYQRATKGWMVLWYKSDDR